MNSSFEPFTVAAGDTQPLTIEGLRSVLIAQEDLRFVAGSDTLVGAADLLRNRRPCLMILDKGFGSQAILQMIVDLGAHLTSTGLILWGASITEPEAVRFIHAGVRGVLRKSAPIPSVLACLRAVAEGATWMEEAIFRDPPGSGRYPRSELTRREQQVLELVEQGLKNREIASELGIRSGTVKIHLKHIFEKTGVRGRYGLAISGLKQKGVSAVMAS